MTDFLLELRSEEIPARMQDRAREDLAKLFTAELAKAGLQPGALQTFATPRRLALIARDLPAQTAAVSEETKGPKTSAPPQALEGFLRKTGLTREQLVERDGILFAVIDKPGRATADVLAAAIPAIVRAFPWPKAMRWGAASTTMESLRWVRPLQGIVALFGDDVIDCEIAGITSGAATLGHRFHHPHVITIGNANDYVEKLRACRVIVDQAERRQIIALGATMAARKAGLELVQDEGLLSENAGLTEWPVPLLGRFDEAFLEVPPEVIQLTARVNQKYFVCRAPLPLAGGAGGGPVPFADGAHLDSPSPNPSRKREGDLANAFICTANIDAADGGAKIVEGNRKVLAARLSDAKFFYETDLKVPLEEQAAKLDRIVFHEKLGTVADKVDRVAKLARWLVEEGIVRPSPSPLVGEGRGPSALADGKGEGDADGASAATPPHPSVASLLPPSPTRGEGSLADLAERAARLCKADLVTGMVGEFPELQGLMGGYYAAAQGEHPAIAAAIRDHYKPVGQGDEVPTDPVTVAVSLADKLDTIAQFFAINLAPTGSKDPFALRRAALGIVRLIKVNELRLSLFSAAMHAQMAIQASDEVRDSQAKGIKALTDLLDQLGPEAAMGALKGWIESGRLPSLEVQIREAVLNRVLTAMPICAVVRDFFLERMEVIEREVGTPSDILRAALLYDGGKEDDLVRLLARVRALQGFVGTEDGANLLAGYKRAANILKKEGFVAPSPPVGEGRGPSALADGKGEGDADGASAATPPHPSAASPLPPSPTRGEGYAPEPAETALAAALDAAEPAASAAIEREDFEAAMAALATLRAPIDAFFESVIVNDPEPAKRTARLGLLDRVRAAVHTVADFSKIEG